MNYGTGRDICKRKCVAGFDVGVCACLNLVAYLEAYRSEDVSLLAVGILDKSDMRRTVGIVLKCEDCCLACLISLKVDHAVLSAVSAAAMTDCDSSVAVSAGVL